MRVARLGVVLVAGLLMGSVVTSAVAETAEVTEFEIPSAGRVESVAVAFGSVWTLSDGAEPGSGGPPGMAVGPPVIYELDPQTGAVVDSHTVPTEGSSLYRDIALLDTQFEFLTTESYDST